MHLQFEYLKTQEKHSLHVSFQNRFRSVLLVSAGSYFEHEITAMLANFVREKSNGDERIVKFLEKQAISGKFYQLFDWGKTDLPDSPSKSASKFFSLFGNDFKSQADSDIKIVPTDTEEQRLEKESLRKAIESFLEIGHLRNILVHNNFAVYNVEKTVEELFDLFQNAKPFLDYLAKKLR